VAKRKNHKSAFRVGDVVISVETNNIGLLIERYDIFGGYFSEDELAEEEIPCIYAWEILWSGADLVNEDLPRKQSYTELGLINLIKEGYLKLIKTDSDSEDQQDDNS
tara:strand:- start:56 stop:376 length:321 start_codon:yes stop_codon:yes gene_type:complete